MPVIYLLRSSLVETDVRTVGFSLAYSLATALFGGFTPAASIWLIRLTADKRRPASG